MTWFKKLTGFSEKSGDNVRSNLQLDGTQFTSLVNDRVFEAGQFTTPELTQLREKMGPPKQGDSIQVSEVVANVQSLHLDPENADAVFQVASQFNCLEMAAPHFVPEDGVGIYQHDMTQGPACCISAGGGTIFRNYFVELNGAVGQTTNNQLDCLSRIASYFKNAKNRYWEMQNGYCFPSKSGLMKIEQKLAALSESELNDLRGKLMVGVQSNTQVTLGDSNHHVTQVFCSALPIAYSSVPAAQWDHFPRLILDATYESTFYVAMQNFLATGSPKLYLTLVGGGVFGNQSSWIVSAIERALQLFSGVALDVRIVSYGASKPEVASLVHQYKARS